MLYEKKEYSSMKVYNKRNHFKVRAQGRQKKIEGFQGEKWNLRRIKVREVVGGGGRGKANMDKDPVVGGITVIQETKRTVWLQAETKKSSIVRGRREEGPDRKGF